MKKLFDNINGCCIKRISVKIVPFVLLSLIRLENKYPSLYLFHMTFNVLDRGTCAFFIVR